MLLWYEKCFFQLLAKDFFIAFVVFIRLEIGFFFSVLLVEPARPNLLVSICKMNKNTWILHLSNLHQISARNSPDTSVVCNVARKVYC